MVSKRCLSRDDINTFGTFASPPLTLAWHTGFQLILHTPLPLRDRFLPQHTRCFSRAAHPSPLPLRQLSHAIQGGFCGFYSLSHHPCPSLPASLAIPLPHLPLRPLLLVISVPRSSSAILVLRCRLLLPSSSSATLLFLPPLPRSSTAPRRRLPEACARANSPRLSKLGGWSNLSVKPWRAVKLVGQTLAGGQTGWHSRGSYACEHGDCRQRHWQDEEV